jgi:hypothetical protein
LAASVLGSSASAQPYPLEADDRRFAELANRGRYAEAYALAENAPERFAHWYAYLLFHTVPPKGTYSVGEAVVRAAEHACRYREVNLEAAAYCYETLAVILRWKDQDPRIAQALPGAKLPRLSPSEVDQGLQTLAEKGVSLAVYFYYRSRLRSEALERLVRERPHSLRRAARGGAFGEPPLGTGQPRRRDGALRPPRSRGLLLGGGRAGLGGVLRTGGKAESGGRLPPGRLLGPAFRQRASPSHPRPLLLEGGRGLPQGPHRGLRHPLVREGCLRRSRLRNLYEVLLLPSSKQGELKPRPFR